MPTHLLKDYRRGLPCAALAQRPDEEPVWSAGGRPPSLDAERESTGDGCGDRYPAYLLLTRGGLTTGERSQQTVAKGSRLRRRCGHWKVQTNRAGSRVTWFFTGRP